MDLLTLFGTAIALGMDAFAVAAAIAATLPVFTSRHTFRLTWHFGLFQAMMTTIGWFGGEKLAQSTGGMNTWIAFGLLCLLGANMIRNSFGPEERVDDFDPTRGFSLVALSVATSIDALAVGVSLGLMGSRVAAPALIIGLVAIIMTYVGASLGKRAGGHLGSWAERAGGIVLIALGLRILVMDYYFK